VEFRQGGHGLILWKPGGTVTAILNLDWTPAVVEDMYGNDSPMTGRSLKVGEDPLLIREMMVTSTSCYGSRQVNVKVRR
jgi:hypothetical protein